MRFFFFEINNVILKFELLFEERRLSLCYLSYIALCSPLWNLTWKNILKKSEIQTKYINVSKIVFKKYVFQLHFIYLFIFTILVFQRRMNLNDRFLFWCHISKILLYFFNKIKLRKICNKQRNYYMPLCLYIVKVNSQDESIFSPASKHRNSKKYKRINKLYINT